jgi:hypothetical protein
MCRVDEPIIVQSVDRSVIETISAFVRCRSGFHGDRGIRDYLYHCLMTNLPDCGTYTRTEGGGTLMVQAEWYTTLHYRRTGEAPSRGRFDLGIPKPEELDLPEPHALVAFECGRNKKAVDLLRDIDAAAEHGGPEPADISKLAREINHVGLPYGYACEFYDEDQAQANDLVRRLRLRTSSAESGRLRVVALVCIDGTRPILTFLPLACSFACRTRVCTRAPQQFSLGCCRLRSSRQAVREKLPRQRPLRRSDADCPLRGRRSK